MLRPRPCGTEDDFLKDDNHLSICGSKLFVYKLSKNLVNQRRYEVEHLHAADGDKQQKKEVKGEPYRRHLRLKTTTVRNSAVCSKKLKEIRESVEIEDFRRLLKQLNVQPSQQKNVYNKEAQDKKNLKMDYKCKTVPNHIKTDIDRKVLRETLYSEIFQRHRRSIFALGSFLRMLKSKKSNYNVIKQEGESE